MYITIKRTLLLMCFFMLLLIAKISYAMGMTWYAAPDGVDSNTGTHASSPWPVQTAFATATAGDTVLLRGGVYYLPSTLLLQNSGTAQAPITIMAFSQAGIRERVILHAGEANTTSLAAAIHLASPDGSPQYITVKGIEITGGRQYGIIMDSGNNRILQCYIHGAGIGQIKYPDDPRLLVNMSVTQRSHMALNLSTVTTVTTPSTTQASQDESPAANQTGNTTGSQDEGDGSQNNDAGGGCTVMPGQTDPGLLLLLLFVLLYRLLLLQYRGVKQG